MKKKLAVLLCTAMAVSSLAGCSSGAKDPGKDQEKTKKEDTQDKTEGKEDGKDVLTLEFFQQKSEEAAQVGYQNIIDKFNEQNPDIKIEMNTVPDAPTVLTSRVASGDIPVIFTDFPTQLQFHQKVANGYVQDLSEQGFLKNVEQSALEYFESLEK